MLCWSAFVSDYERKFHQKLGLGLVEIILRLETAILLLFVTHFPSINITL